MIVNLIVIFLTMFLGILFSKNLSKEANSDWNRKKYISIICFILILQSGLRHVATGEDTFNYFNVFEDMKSATWRSTWEFICDYYTYGIGKDPGYDVFQKLILIVSGSYRFYLFVVAIIFFSALGNFIYKNTTRLVDAVLAFVIYSVLYYSFYSITGIRQTIATAFTLFSYEFIKKRKFIPFLILILLASTIHKSALVYLPFYFVVRINSIKYFYGGVLLLFPVLMIYKNEISILTMLIGGYEAYEKESGAGTFTFTLMFLSVSLAALLRNKSIMSNNKNAQHYFNAFAIILLFLPLSWINPSGMRIVMYFTVFLLLFVPEIIYSLQKISYNVRFYTTITAFIVLIVLYIRSNLNTPIPYGFFWEKMQLNSHYLYE